MNKIINDFINSIDNKLYNRIRQSKSDAECRRYLKEHLQKQCDITNVSKTFNSEEELLQFIYMNTPIAIKPKSKRAKGQLVSAFKSSNAFDKVCRHLAKKLFNRSGYGKLR